MIPQTMPKLSGFGESFQYRFNYIQQYGFVFVSWDWIEPLVQWIGSKKCLEVMSGKGTLSYALRKKGVDVIATDDFSWAKKEEFSSWKTTYTEIENIDAVEAVNKYGKDIDILIMSWPYMDNTAYIIIKKLNEINPNALVVYIGEGYGGCTANSNFFDCFEEIEDEFFNNQVTRKYKSFPSIYDRPILGKYKES
jgi:hypothetical protein